MVESGVRIFAWGGGTGFFLSRNDTELVLEKTMPLGGVLAALKIDGTDHLLSREWEVMPILWDLMETGPAEKLPLHATPQVLRMFPGGFV
jgi:hypothetical protein